MGHHISSEDTSNQLSNIAPLIESHHVEPIIEAVPSCTNSLNAEQQQTTLKRKWSPHGLKSKKKWHPTRKKTYSKCSR